MGRTYDYDVRGPGAFWPPAGNEGIGGPQGLGLYNSDMSTEALGFSEGY
uniref:Uncharacterized protein n=1 Tax=viral metagenome TaxID=1070528 RepID=A0A6C0IWP3_9ZZZZ